MWRLRMAREDAIYVGGAVQSLTSCDANEACRQQPHLHRLLLARASR